MIKKRKPLDDALSQFVFGSTEPTAEPSPPVLLESTPAPSPPQESIMSKLQAPDKEATVRFTVDMSESLHRKLSMLAAKTRRKKVDIVRMLLEEGLKDVEE
ncbi:hypothetical protein [Microcoleus sp.]|uniref:hypothetical protein n=1 Tax=Microcoleus sp. TaxID=44472 RepID=UPI0035263515